MKTMRSTTRAVLAIIAVVCSLCGASAQSISLTSFQDGATYVAGQTYQINWSTVGIPADADMVVTLVDTRVQGDTPSGNAVVGVCKNTGSFSWTISAGGSLQYMQIGGHACYQVVVAYASNGAFVAYDASAQTFSISYSARIAVLNPNGVPVTSGTQGPMEVWGLGSNQRISYQCTGAQGGLVVLSVVSAVTGHEYFLPGYRTVTADGVYSDARWISGCIPQGVYRVKATLLNRYRIIGYDFGGSVVIQAFGVGPTKPCRGRNDCE